MNKSKTFGEKVIQGSIIAISFTFVGSVAAYLIRVIYSRSLSVEMYGLFFAVFGFFNMISTYTGFGFGHAITYFVPKHLKLGKYKELWNTFIYGQIIQVGGALVFSLILIAAAPFLSKNYFKVPGSETLIYIFCMFLVLTSLLNGLLQIFTGLQKVKYFSSINVLRTSSILFFSLIFISMGLNNTIFYGLSWVLGYLITTVFFLYLLWIKYPYLSKNTPFWQKDTFKVMYKYALPTFSSVIISSLMVSSDTFLLTLFKGVKQVGIYNIIVPVASIPIIFLSPLNNIFFPLVSHLSEGEKDKLNYLVGKIYEFVPLVGTYFALFIIMFPSSTIGLIFGQKWLGPSELPLAILSLGYIASLMEGISSTIALGVGKSNQRLKIYVIVAVITVILHVILIKQFGVLGAVTANSISYFLLNLMFTGLIKRVIDFKIPYRFYFKIFLFSVLLYSIIRLIGFSPSNLFEFILSGVIYSIIFAAFGYLIKAFDKRLLAMILPNKERWTDI